jgi:hypothetical protein
MPPGIARKLWVKAGGRCEYCNEPLWKDSLTQKDMNKAYISHIVAAKPKGPRGHASLSKKFETDFSNLMLLCDECHNRIDEADVNSHPVKLLHKLKKEHENRIELLTSIKIENRSHNVVYTASVGKIIPKITTNDVFTSIIPEHYPAENRALRLSMEDGPLQDNEPLYWEIELKNLLTKFSKKITPIIEEDAIQLFTIHAIAPQPLLIKLGTLFSDIANVDVYQKHREPSTWRWQTESKVHEFILKEPQTITKTPVLIFALSAYINEERIHNVLGNDCSIWIITIDNPNNDFLKTKLLLEKFRRISHDVLNKIKTVHGENIPLHVFPAMPVSTAIEFGRVWQSKADLPLIIYDQNNERNGFIKTLEIKSKGGL